ncbi:unnamed protein product [Ectocarpus sp. CCAP 1310/34]|nr:unnamed protein product [Ectocarpus sp. CCAP 1310/34]
MVSWRPGRVIPSATLFASDGTHRSRKPKFVFDLQLVQADQHRMCTGIARSSFPKRVYDRSIVDIHQYLGSLKLPGPGSTAFFQHFEQGRHLFAVNGPG